jgi:hypothetical protein
MIVPDHKGITGARLEAFAMFRVPGVPLSPDEEVG